MERYEAYKDSGVEWIGEIPASWSVHRVKDSCAVVAGATPKSDISEYWDGNIPWITPADYSETQRYVSGGSRSITELGLNSCGTTLVPKGSVIVSNRAPIGLVSVASCPLSTNQGCKAIVPLNDSVLSEYLYWYLLTQTGALNSLGRGTTFLELSTQALSTFVYPSPSLKEQQAIADYLDAKTAEIDALVADCEREVGLLREYRKAVISEAVTKGLDPDAPMKESMSKWVSSIPEGWAVVPLKHFSKLITDGVHQTPEYIDAGIPFLSIKDMSNGAISFEDCKYISYEQHIELSKHAPIEEGDLLFARIGTLGVTVVVRDCPEFDIFVSLGLIKLKRGAINEDYLAYCMNSDYYCSYIQTVKAGGGTAAAKFNLSDVSNSPIIQPPIGEQAKIASFLHAKTAEIDSLIEAKQTMADKLREYRKSLISEAVTGKFKVPGV